MKSKITTNPSCKTAILTNQSAFGWKKNYHFINFKKYFDIQYILLPEHGLFAELQDQKSGSDLKYNYRNIKIINLYGDQEKSLTPPEYVFEDTEQLIIDIRDVGSRYYTFLTTALYCIQEANRICLKNNCYYKILVTNPPNPAGRKIEGSPLQKQFESFVGVESVLHRHGLTTAELLCYYQEQYCLDRLQIEVLPRNPFYKYSKKHDFWIPPSPNIPSINTCLVYPGQCLLEGTNISEGRGTTKPFETFGAPFINIDDERLLKELSLYQKKDFLLRPLLFSPTFHKYTNQIIGGFQILLFNPKKFHSLLFTLHFIKTIMEFYPKEFSFLQGVYEFRSDKPAIELLCGDSFLLKYLEGKVSYKNLKEYFMECESEWNKKIKKFII